MTYSPAKFEVAMSNSLERMHLQEIFDLTLKVTQSIALYIMRPVYLQSLFV